MAIKHVKDFEFDPAFGFSGSAAKEKSAGKGYARGGPTRDDAPGREPASPEPTISMPASVAARTAQSLVSVGRQQGATNAVQDLAQLARGRRGVNPAGAMMPASAMESPVAQAPGPVAPSIVPPGMSGGAPPPGPPGPGMAPQGQIGGMKNGGRADKFIQKAMKHPGALTKKANTAGETPMQFAKAHEHDSGKTGRQARFAEMLNKVRPNH